MTERHYFGEYEPRFLGDIPPLKTRNGHPDDPIPAIRSSKPTPIPETHVLRRIDGKAGIYYRFVEETADGCWLLVPLELPPYNGMFKADPELYEIDLSPEAMAKPYETFHKELLYGLITLDPIALKMLREQEKPLKKK
jgi:hypothetical protein